MDGDVLNEFFDGRLQPNLDAAREQACLIACLYARDDEGIRMLCEMDNRPTYYLARHSTTSAWLGSEPELVNLVLLVQDDVYHLALAGTENAYQWLGNATGIFFDGYFNGTNAVVHHYFRRMADLVWEKIKPVLPADMSGATIRISGHSLGGAAAFLLACRLLREHPGINLQLMTFGEPRSLTDNYDGQLPFRHVRIVNTGDIVSVAPPANALTGYRYIDPSNPEFGKLVNLRHFGNQTWLFLSGAVAPPGFAGNDPDTVVGVPVTSLTNHYIINYAEILHKNALLP